MLSQSWSASSLSAAMTSVEDRALAAAGAALMEAEMQRECEAWLG